jgi:HPt (histidine-containing phosphotransfer) domain-containing protein
VQQLALQLSAKWRLAADARPGATAGASSAAAGADESIGLLERIDSLLSTLDEPAAADTPDGALGMAAAGDGGGLAPPLCWAVLRERCQGDIDFCRQLLQAYNLRVVDQLTAIEQAAKTGDADALARRAHAAKSVAATLAAEDICRAAAELEHLGRRANLSDVEAALRRLRLEVERCLEYIPQLLSTIAAANQEETNPAD